MCDVKQVEDLAKLAVENFGGIDYWINNAGTNGYEYDYIINQSPETLEEVVKTNALGTLLCCRQAIKTMAERTEEKNNTRGIGYHIFNMEGAGSDGNETTKYAAYGFTKAGMSQLTKTLNKELESSEEFKAIKVHTVSPGMVFTDLISSGRYAFGSQGRMFVNTLAEPANVVASGLIEKITTELENSAGRKSLAIKMLTPDVAIVKLFNRFTKQIGKDRYYPEEEECENGKSECVVSDVQSVNLLNRKTKDGEEKVVEKVEEIQENTSGR